MSSSHHIAATNDLKELSFEDALKELEKIVRGLEGGKLSLEDALTSYERGTALRQHCEKRLAEAEMRVQNIVQSPPQTLQEGTENPSTPQKTSRTKKTAAQKPASEEPDGAIPDYFNDLPF